MPGIHVRSVGKFNWEDQNKEPMLTVPGSYWLCHKNNIYKFTFKFHKSLRNATNFVYSKELMKIIRRVIKWQPKQGQHFSTKNLLVTYNHASWTRQDKTFAVMKFCDRPDATAFPHAFILTVKILDQEQQFKIEEMGAKIAKPDPEKSLCPIDGNLTSSNGLPTENRRDQEYINNIMLTNGQKEKENSDSEHTPWSPRTRTGCKEFSESLTMSVTTPRANEVSHEPEDEDDNSEKTETIEQSMEQMCDSSVAVSESPEESPNLTDEPITEKANSSDVEDESDYSDSQSESASLPYQYLIEKDIERTLESFRLAELANSQNEDKSDFTERVPSPVSLPVSDDVKNHFDSLSKDQKISSSNTKFRSRQNSQDSDSLPPPEVANLKSSDITDLVMKGLMFTIRQDKDAVTVVEQKTKLELDEVLENSEKVETKAGDSCLLNSSLLRLEKMVTRIREPVCLPENNGNELNPLVSYMDQCNVEVDPEFVQRIEQNLLDKESSTHSISNLYDDFDELPSSIGIELKSSSGVPTSRNCESSDGDMELKLSEIEEEEDIVPEAFANNVLLNETTQSKESQDQLVHQNVDERLSAKAFVDIEILSSKRLKCASVIDSINTNKNSNKLPKVISNTVVTNDQLSPLLQKVLQNKLVVNKNLQSTVDNDMLLNEEDGADSVKNDNNEVKKASKDNELNSTFEVDFLDADGEMIESIETMETSNIDSFNYGSNNMLDILDKTDEIIKIAGNMINETDSTLGFSSSINDKFTEGSYSNTLSELRTTRSSSKLQLLPTCIADELISNDSGLKQERKIETRSQKMLEKSLSNQSNKISVQQKRKNSTTDKCISKVHKSSDSINGLKDVNINMNKLLSDLKYGVKITVERLDLEKNS
ncbi:uncharacterized protein LOC106640645 [Copidosoma floridanum]|uniref:uncharacterized protein LOC106640645 n=1 Tax=Copidosoma floridanum TaxID=29053 RepID=UPI0006C94DA8|nr:uncharacterized protein LOC106640645 [Copidosoma floridanum]